MYDHGQVDQLYIINTIRCANSFRIKQIVNDNKRHFIFAKKSLFLFFTPLVEMPKFV